MPPFQFLSANEDSFDRASKLVNKISLMIDFGILMTGQELCTHDRRARFKYCTPRREVIFDLDKIDERDILLFQQRIDVSCFTSPSVGVVFSNLLDLY